MVVPDNYDSTYFCAIDSKKYVLVEAEQAPAKGHVLTVLPHLYMAYEVKLEVMVFGLATGTWVNLLHLTNSGNTDKYGGSNPSIWAYGSSAPYFRIHSAIDANKGWRNDFHNFRIPTNSWIEMTVAQKFEHGIWMYTVTIDGTQLYGIQNNVPVDLTNVKVYASNPWYAPLNGSIRRLEISTRGIN